MKLVEIKNSIAFRIPYLYKGLISLFGRRMQKRNIQPHNPNMSIVMLSGVEQLDFLQETLLSIKKTFSFLPTIYIFTDKGLDVQTCHNRIKWLKLPNVEIIDAQTCIQYHTNNENNLISTFADQNPMGLKLAAIIQIAARGKPLLYCDTDVLWFNDPTKTLSTFLDNPFFQIAMSQDFQPAYDENLIKKGELKELKTTPYYCAGILFLKSFTEDNKNRLELLLKIATTHSTHFTEQTIFAYLNKISGNYSLEKEQFLIPLEEQFNLLPTINKNLIAKHYVGPIRHQFWRDSLFLRIN